jgi:curved DNA-binding protein CbpA
MSAKLIQSGEELQPPGPDYSIEEISAYYLELERLLDRVEKSETHYQVLEVDNLATTNEIKLAYMRCVALLNPSYYGLNVPRTDEFLPRIDRAFDSVSKAFSALVNFSKRVEYDNHLFGRKESAARQETLRLPVNGAELNEMIQDEIARRKNAPPSPKLKNRRRHERFRLSIPVRVNGFSAEADEWHEMTQSIDVSRGGVLLRLHRQVEEGMILFLTMPLPVKLRNYDYFDTSYSVYAIVRWAHGAEKDMRLAGLEFLGDQLDKASHQNEGDQRPVPNKKVTKIVGIEYFNQSLDYIKRESAFAESLNPDGMRICVKEPPAQFEMARITSKPDSFESFATVTNRYVGTDGFERICLQFIDNEWPVD